MDVGRSYHSGGMGGNRERDGCIREIKMSSHLIIIVHLRDDSDCYLQRGLAGVQLQRGRLLILSTLALATYQSVQSIQVSSRGSTDKAKRKG